MKFAIKSVQSKTMGWLKAAKTFNVPHTTLQRRVTQENKTLPDNSKDLGRHRPTFDAKTEEEFVQHILDLDVRFYGLTFLEVRKLTFEMAGQNGVLHRFN